MSCKIFQHENDLNNQDNDDDNSKCVTLYSDCYFAGESINLCGSHSEITDQL